MEYYKKEDIIYALEKLKANLELAFGEDNAYVFTTENIIEMILTIPVEIIDNTNEGETNVEH